MADIVDLDALVGGDLVFKYGGEELKIPGDINTQRVFEIFNAFQELHGVTEEGDPAEIERANALIREQLLKLFQIRQPEMEELPFGIKTTPIVIQEILKLLGVNVRDEDEDSPPEEGGKIIPLPRPGPKSRSARTRKTTSARKKTQATSPRKS